jgi:tRNA A-37 threonylcarbamoyl transferase component Bud32
MRNKKGGKNISGSYGCALIPSLIIKNGKRDPKYVTKIFYNPEEYIKEKQKADLVKKIDGRGLFTVANYNESPVDFSRVLLSEEQTKELNEPYENNLENCGTGTLINYIKNNKLSELKYLNYPYAGISFTEYINDQSKINKDKLDEMIIAIYILFVNIIFMNDNNYYHYDISNSNITYNELESKCYLIDYGYFKYDVNPKEPLRNDIFRYLTKVSMFFESITDRFSSGSAGNNIPDDKKLLIKNMNTSLDMLLEEISRTIEYGNLNIEEIKKYRQTIKEKFKTIIDTYLTSTSGGKRNKTYKTKIHNKLKTLRKRKVRRNVH